MSHKFNNYKEAEKYIFGLSAHAHKSGVIKSYSLYRIKQAAEILGRPQEKFKSIHIAATSGKGSTSTFISKMLVAHGFKVGLTVSPHLTNIRERIQINNKPISEKKFTQYLNEIYSHNLPWLSYFEVMTLMAFYTFAKEKVDYAMIETGLGGTLDATNIIYNKDKIAIVGKIGFDHMHILGNTIEEITSNKAGIIQNSQELIYLEQSPEINKVIIDRANQTKSRVTKHTTDTKILSDNFKVKNLPTYQIENFGLALKTLEIISFRDGFKLNNDKIQEVLDNFGLTGRFQYEIIKGRMFILDGAHNPQKISAFVNSVKHKYPGKKFVVIYGSKKREDIKEILEIISSISGKLILTEFNSHQDIEHKSISQDELVRDLNEIGFKNHEKTKNTQDAINKAVKYESEPIIITGSLYLISEVLDLISKYRLQEK